MTIVRSPQYVKCPVLSNHLINFDSVHGLLENSEINFFSKIFQKIADQFSKLGIKCIKFYLNSFRFDISIDFFT